MAEEARKYLDYDGLKHLVEKLTDRIEASGGGTAQGVYVAYVDTGGANRICKPSDWSADMGTCCGVAVVENGRAMLVAPTMSESAMTWSGSVSNIGAYTADSINYASQDYAGRGNTEKAVSAGYDAENVGFGFCYAYSYGDVGPGKWWMPAMGEMKAMRENLDGLGEALEAIGGDPIDGTVLWSSTQNGSGSKWTMNVRDGVASTDSSSGRHYVRPVSEWVWTEATGGGNIVDSTVSVSPSEVTAGENGDPAYFTLKNDGGMAVTLETFADCLGVYYLDKDEWIYIPYPEYSSMMRTFYATTEFMVRWGSIPDDRKGSVVFEYKDGDETFRLTVIVNVG